MTVESFMKRWKKLGLHSNAEIAQACTMNPSTVSRWLSGETPIPSWMDPFLHNLEVATECRSEMMEWKERYENLAAKLKAFKDLLESV